jgi:hypothetical protein
MNAFSRPLLTLCLLAALGACSKKAPAPERAESSANQPLEPARAQPETPPPPAATSTADPAPAADAGAPQPTADSPPAAGGVPADLVAADAAYEAWFKKHNLNLGDAAMLDEDPDGDGSTNRDEFLADTNPRDATSRPGVATGLRLKEFVRKELPFVLKSVEGETAQIERSDDGAKRTETVKTGQPLKGSSYRVMRVQSRAMRDKDGNPVDGSRVTLEDSTTRQRVELIKDLPSRSSASYAVLTSADGAKTMTVHEGDTFTWPDQPAVSYKVKDLRAEQVILEDLTNGKTVTVPKKP